MHPPASFNPYTKANPCQAHLLNRILLSSISCSKKTYHITLQLPENFHYRPGDCIGIYPENEIVNVEKTLKALNFTGKEIIFSHKEQKEFFLFDWLKTKANLSHCSAHLLKEIAHQNNLDSKELKLQEFTPWEILTLFPLSLDLNSICDFFSPLLPRFYSIASMANDQNQLDLLITFASHYNRYERKGVASEYICHTLKNEDPISIFYHPAEHFQLAEDHQPILMIGAGTGLAPYRGFMQARQHNKTMAPSWLFFGEWTKQDNYYWEKYWTDLEKNIPFKITCAFSREQEEKIYVQNRLEEFGATIWEWIEKGCVLYVCGDAHHMAKSVDATLIKICEIYGAMEHERAQQFMRQLRHEGRYRRDVY